MFAGLALGYSLGMIQTALMLEFFRSSIEESFIRSQIEQVQLHEHLFSATP